LPEPAHGEVVLTGTGQPPPTMITLRAGDTEALLVDGDLRAITRGGTELVRRVYVAIRDLDWNTLPGETEDLTVSGNSGAFAVSFTRRHRMGKLDYRWRAEITGSSGGDIRYRMSGEALSDFDYAKIGICVHHPIAGFAGQPFSGTCPDGPVSGRLPLEIGPQIRLADGTDLPLFEPVQDLEIGHESGGVVRFGFTGDLWEMEDQRNWTDASYKSASTPARLGYYHTATQGQRFEQDVLITSTGFGTARAPAPAVNGHPRHDLEIGAETGTRVPPIGLGCADPAQPLSPQGLAVLRAVSPAHLRIDLDLAAPEAPGRLRAAGSLAEALSCALELAFFVPAGGITGPALLREELGRLRSPVARVLAFGAGEEASSPRTVDAARAVAGDMPDTPVVAGTNIYFNELNRHRPPLGRAGGLAWSVNPQIHAFDELSLMENLQAQPDTVATARWFAPGALLFVTPITLRPRFNAVASTDEEFRTGGLPWEVDPRQPSLFAAAWTLGSAAGLARAGADGLTYYDTTGERGVVAGPEGTAYPGMFHAIPDMAYPLALVLSDLCALRGRPLRAVSHTGPAGLAALAAGTPDGTSLLVANLTRETRTVHVTAPGAANGRARILDAAGYQAATTGPARFLGAWTARPAAADGAVLTLGPYAVARWDLMP
jgi:D-apionolactonase